MVKMVYNLLDLPHEVLHGIFVNVNLPDLASLCCCRALNDFIRCNLLLHKELYLRNFDEPPLRFRTEEIPLYRRLQELVYLQKTLESDNVSWKLSQLQTIANSVDYLLETTATTTEPSLNITFLTRLFESRQNVNTLLCRSALFDRAKQESWGNLSTNRLRRDIASALTDAQSTRSSHRDLDLATVGSSIITEEDEAAGEDLANLVEAESEKSARLRRASSARRTNSGNICEKGSMFSYDESQRSLQHISAKLHCLYGVSIDTVRKDTSASPRYSLRSDTAPIHPYARSLVYDLRQHTDASLWGPFLNDGSQKVDWEKVEAIMIILDYNMRLSSETHQFFEGVLSVQSKPFVGATSNSFVSPQVSIPLEPATPLELQDPYNITGNWMRVVCFLDYTELYDFNFDGETIPWDQPRQPIDTDEAIRLITMRLRVTRIEAPGEEDGQGLPVVHFKGESSSLRPSDDRHANSKTKGTVRLTPHGDVRWTTFTVFHGSSEERWRSESIQVGGVRSARGVLGYWFDKNFDEHGPAGPTSFWKIHDGIEEPKRPGAHSPMTRFTIPLY